MSIVELDQLLTADIPDLDGVICRAAGNARAIRVKANRVDRTFVEIFLINALFILRNNLLGRNIPGQDFGVVGSRSNKSGIRRKHRRVDPVRVSIYEAEHKLTVLQLVHHHRLVVGSGQN
jgi:hypothetical protein